MSLQLDSAEAIEAVDAVLAGVGLQHGRRHTRPGTWREGERQLPEKPRSASRHAEARKGQPGLVPIPEWSRFPWLRAGFSTREGGRSTVYAGADHGKRIEPGELNLGWTRDDDPEVVAENRRKFLAAVAGSGMAGMRLLTARQMHSGLIRTVADTADSITPEGKPVLRGDALLTEQPGLMLGIITADCVPVLLADTRTRAVGAFHAGWRGTLARIVERGVGSMRLQFGSRPQDLVAAIGPAIGSCCFAVGEEVKFDFESQFAYATELTFEVYDSDPVRDKYPLLFMTARAPGHSNIGPQIHLDLVEANRRQLVDAGVPEGSVSVAAECTACTRLQGGRRKYFSHRAEHGFTGRMLSVIGAEGRE